MSALVGPGRTLGPCLLGDSPTSETFMGAWETMTVLSVLIAAGIILLVGH